MFDNKTLLITGGTGSLGTALLTRAQKENWNCHIKIYSRDESKQSKTRALFPYCEYILGDVVDYDQLMLAMRNVNIVFHFAAYKQVPAAQHNVPSAIRSNIIGSWNVVQTAILAGVEKVVASSTDKACQAVNAYGNSKALMEVLFQYGNKFDTTTFHLARYGNVIGSTGSVIPLFLKQQQEGKPITVTSETMTRFWITLEQAVDLILMALEQEPGVIVVPKASAMSMGKLARLFGDNIQTIGIRPGEKEHEMMVAEAESFHTIELENHFLIHPPINGSFNTEAPFSYTSDLASQMSTKEMMEIIDAL